MSTSKKNSTTAKSTFQGRREISPAWFKELCTKEEHLWKQDYEGDIAKGPMTEPFPRRRPREMVSPSPNRGTPLGWSFDQVSVWLGKIGLSRHIKMFRKHRISGPALLSLRAEHLEVLELNLKDQCVFLRQINELNKQVRMKSSELRRKQNIQSVRRIQRHVKERDARNKFVRTLNTKIRNVERDRRGVVWMKCEKETKSDKSSKNVHFKKDISSDRSISSSRRSRKKDVLPPRWNRKSDNTSLHIARRTKTLDSSKMKKENDLLVSKMKHLFESHRLRLSGKSSSSKTNRSFFYMRQR